MTRALHHGLRQPAAPPGGSIEALDAHMQEGNRWLASVLKTLTPGARRAGTGHRRCGCHHRGG
ncbi:hypothetical protein [Streptomyces lomondensis]|uniref:Uncharacterized protein n=1 Tax=Streptomyces lomondensis TaxID=68229 RepID=A0ABQ2X2K6_9ACTN|nr:hypothetical protein [Streptomyces lomondensis]MCF0082580.1 hypothetical protein [Streptomyces lomondensis]GGW94784.1 hypothetical protein GCM10010383_25450 [Streptomyces lomondensis]